jgi:hypothetical protein
MSRFTLDRFGREADALQLDSAASDPLVGDDFLETAGALGPDDGLAALLAAEDYGTEDDDAYWRELHLRQLAEGGGCDYDEYDPTNWIHRRGDAAVAGPAATAFLDSARARLNHDFHKIIGRLR